jgi:hypothetical protein
MKTFAHSIQFLAFLLLCQVSQAASKKIITGPTGSDNFGANIRVLPNGNFVVLDNSYDQPSPAVANVGAVYLYRQDGTLISSITGSTASDAVGTSITTLNNGHFVIRSSNWSSGRGAFTWGNAETGFIGGGGVVSASNSVVGSTGSDAVSNQVLALNNGNYVIAMPFWDNGAATNAGAVTWCDGATGRTGAVSGTNSLVGLLAFDSIGSGSLQHLPNGNVVVRSPTWNNGLATDAGAVTLIPGRTGRVGAVSASNSLVGDSTGDMVGSRFTLLTNGNYVISSPQWDDAGADAGAVTFCYSQGGPFGVVNNFNSLIGKPGDEVGSGPLEALTNGHYVVCSPDWFNPDSISTAAGAATWCNGVSGSSGLVTTANSLVGLSSNDRVGNSGAIALTNGNYVVNSEDWNNGSSLSAGAVTWGNGSTGTTGAVSAANSLVGTTSVDRVGSGGIYPLTNGNYVVVSLLWDSPSAVDAGAVTWGNGRTGISGPVSQANSLIGASPSDRVGSGNLRTLPSGNYVVGSPLWNNGSTSDAGAVTWGSGTKGVKGIVGRSNSLVGSSLDDEVGRLGSVTVLTNGNYVIHTRDWNGPGAIDGGAVTWASGTSGIRGIISAANSLIGGSFNDQIGNFGIHPLSTGNYMVASPTWANGGIANAGAATWCDGKRPTKGRVSAANSLVGSTVNDNVGESIAILFNGNYLVRTRHWDNGLLTDAGAVTWGDGTKGVRGTITAANSLVGSSAMDLVGDSAIGHPDGSYSVRSSDYSIPLPLQADVSAQTLCDASGSTTGTPDPSNSVFGTTSGSSLIPVYDTIRARLFVGDPDGSQITILGNSATTLSRSGESAPGAQDIAWAKPGLISVNAAGSALFESALTGAGSTAGRTTGMFGLTAGASTPDLVMQSGDLISGLGQNLPTGAKASKPRLPLFHEPSLGLFQITATGPGITASNNQLLLRDNGFSITPLHRTGTPVSLLGGASLSKMVEVLANYTQDTIFIHHQLRPGSAPGVNSSNDSGILFMNSNGEVIPFTIVREGQSGAPWILPGTLGQITRTSPGQGNLRSYFLGSHRPPSGPAETVVFIFQIGGITGTIARSGQVAPGTGGATYRSFFSLTNGRSANGVYKASLTGPTTENQGLWKGVNLLLRKGSDVNTALYSGLKFGSVSRIWSADFTGNEQFVIQCTLTGDGVNSSNNQALVLLQETNGNTILMRTGTDPTNQSPKARGIGNATVKSISAVDVNPLSGDYVVLTTLNGSPSSSNQALWTGNTATGDDTTLRTLREPTLRLRKGERYTSTSTALGVIKSISITPYPDPSGSGGRGHAHCIGENGHVAVTITADRNLSELVLLP